MHVISDQTTIAAVTAVDAAQKLEITAAVAMRPRVCRLTLHDCDDSITKAAVVDADLQFAWEINQTYTQSLFTGQIETVSTPKLETVELVGFDSFRKLQTERLTLTLMDATPAEMLRTLVGQKLGLPIGGIEDWPSMLDKLPMHRMTVIEAVKFIHQRMNLSHDCYFDEDGVFVWRERDYDQAPAYGFEVGYDADNFDLAANSFTTQGVPLRLAQVVTLIDSHDNLHTLFVTGLHFVDDGYGSSIDVTFEVVDG